jgi:hypothetical protein
MGRSGIEEAEATAPSRVKQLRRVRKQKEVFRVAGACNQLPVQDVSTVKGHRTEVERSLRRGVIWRKLSCGTQSAIGSRFVGRMLSVFETCRKQERDVFALVLKTDNTKAYQGFESLPVR